MDVTIYPADVVTELHEHDMCTRSLRHLLPSSARPMTWTSVITTVNVHETAPGVVRVIAYSTSANSTAIIAQYFSPVPILRVNHNLTTSNRGKHTHTFLLLVIPRA